MKKTPAAIDLLIMQRFLIYAFRWQHEMGELLRDAAARGDSDQVVKLLGEGAKPALDEVT